MNMKLNWANRITILRILLTLPFVICMLKINDQSLSPTIRNALRHIATCIFFVIAVSDGVDGFLARVKHQVTKLGSFLDPMADKLLMACACLLLASERAHVNDFLLPSTVVVLILGKDLFLLIGFVVVYFTTFKVRVEPVFIGKVATTLQLVMVAAILLAPEMSYLIPGWKWFLRFLWWSAAGTAILATLIYIRTGSRYIEQEERRLSEQSHA